MTNELANKHKCTIAVRQEFGHYVAGDLAGRAESDPQPTAKLALEQLDLLLRAYAL